MNIMIDAFWRFSCVNGTGPAFGAATGKPAHGQKILETGAGGPHDAAQAPLPNHGPA